MTGYGAETHVTIVRGGTPIVVVYYAYIEKCRLAHWVQLLTQNVLSKYNEMSNSKIIELVVHFAENCTPNGCKLLNQKMKREIEELQDEAFFVKEVTDTNSSVIEWNLAHGGLLNKECKKFYREHPGIKVKSENISAICGVVVISENYIEKIRWSGSNEILIDLDAGIMLMDYEEYVLN